MTEYLPVVKSSQQLTSKINTASTLLGRGLATIQKKQLLIADQDARYRRARDIYDRITGYGLERRFDPKILPKPGTQFDLFADESVNPLQPLNDQINQLFATFRQLKQLAEEGYGKAYFVLARMYFGGQGVPKNTEKWSFYNDLSSKWLFNHRVSGDPEIWRDLAWTHDYVGNQPNYSQAVFWYRKAAEQGNTDAQNNLGIMYANSRGVAQDFIEAVYWYRKAAEQGNAIAQNNLGWMYLDGRGVEKNYEQAVYWHRKAAEQGYTTAQVNLGWIYENSVGVEQDYGLAVYWYRKAAEQGSAYGQNNLGKMYEAGQGVEQDYEQAVDWYRKAVDQEYATAQSNLGIMYRNGRGVEQNDELAVYWWRKAAEQGVASAQNNLGVRYENGQGVEQDDEQAVYWYRKAAEQGDANGQINLNRQQQKMYAGKTNEQLIHMYHEAIAYGDIDEANMIYKDLAKNSCSLLRNKINNQFPFEPSNKTDRPYDAVQYKETIDQYHESIAYGDVESANAIYKTLEDYQYLEFGLKIHVNPKLFETIKPYDQMIGEYHNAIAYGEIEEAYTVYQKMIEYKFNELLSYLNPS